MANAYRADFDKLGWCLLPHFFSTDEVARIALWSDQVLDRARGVEARMVYGETSLTDPDVTLIRRIERFCDDHMPFNDLLRHGRHLAIVATLLGGPACLFKEKINTKFSGGSGYGVHQDQQAGWTAFAPVFVTAMICIDRINSDNGGFRIANIARCNHLVAGEWRDLDYEQSQRFNLKEIALEPGDLLLFDSFVPHGSGPNLTQDVRRAVFATYNNSKFGDQRSSYFSLKEASAPPLASWPT